MSSTNATSSQKQELTLAESQAEVSSQTQQPSFLHLEAPRHAPRPAPSCGQFLGRGWLFREVHQHLSSHLPTNRCSVAQWRSKRR